MKVKINSNYAGPLGSYRPGDVADLPQPEAYALCEGGFAEQIVEASEVAAEPAAVSGLVSDEIHELRPAPAEEADVESAVAVAPETATAPAQNRKSPPRRGRR